MGGCLPTISPTQKEKSPDKWIVILQEREVPSHLFVVYFCCFRLNSGDPTLSVTSNLETVILVGIGRIKIYNAKGAVVEIRFNSLMNCTGLGREFI